MYLAEARILLLGRLNSTEFATINFWPEDSMLPAWETFSTSGGRMQFLLGKIQLSGRRIEIYPADSGSFLLERHCSILVETIISRPED